MSSLDERAQRIARIIAQIAKNLRLPSLVDSVSPGLTTSQMLILVLLEESDKPALSMSEIAADLGVSLPTVTSLVDRLVGRDLVERGASERDRRLVLLRLTPYGREVIHQILLVIGELVKHVLADVSEAEQEQFASGTERVFELSRQVRERQKHGLAAGHEPAGGGAG